jgi:S1-C subfamily serine protease
MDYYIANAMDINITYGWLITSILSNSPAEAAGLKGSTGTATIAGSSIPIGGDIIVAMNSTPTNRITVINGDTLSTYLEEITRPGNLLTLTIKRNGIPALMNVNLTLGTRPEP